MISGESRRLYRTQGVPLYKYALADNWDAAKVILLDNKNLLRTGIAQGQPTVLHVAAGANNVKFVREVVKLMDNNDLVLQDYKGNTALCFAATVGNVEIAKIMVAKNQSLPTIRGGHGLTPLHLAALHGRSDMAWYLYHLNTHQNFGDADWNKLFITCINTQIYGKHASIIYYIIYIHAPQYNTSII